MKLISLLLALLTSFFVGVKDKEIKKEEPENINQAIINTSKLKILKDVGEAYLEKFGLKDNDFKLIHEAGFNLIEGNFDICANDEDVVFFLNEAQKYQLKVILPAGSGEAEWGYECDSEPYPKEQRPNWQKEDVQNWIKKWKDHPAVWGWDLSNEAGGNFPNSDRNYWLSKEDLKKAYQDIKEVDLIHPVVIRINGWFFYDYNSNFFREENPFTKDMTDFVMINAYSNVQEYFYDFVDKVLERATNSIRDIDPKVKVLVALGAWEETPLWYLPSAEHIKNDFNSTKKFNIAGIAFFKYGAEDSNWYLPKYKEAWNSIKQVLKEY